MENVVAYVRVSTQEQAKHSGLDRQRYSISAYAEKHNLNIVKWFDDSMSGARGDRPGLQDMLAAIENDWTIKAVIVESYDRLARGYGLTFSLGKQLEDMNCDLLVVQQGTLASEYFSRVSSLVEDEEISEDTKALLKILETDYEKRYAPLGLSKEQYVQDAVKAFSQAT